MASTIRYPINRVVNWYWGNFCTRKCFNKEARLGECHEKFQLFVSHNKDLMITHKDFKDLSDKGHIMICRLKPNFRKKIVGWNQFEDWTRDPEFDADKFD